MILSRILVGLVILGSGLWLGGLVAIVLVNSTMKSTVSPVSRTAFFRSFGRKYLVVAAIALIFIVVPGTILLTVRPWDAFTLAIVVCVAALIVVTFIGVLQARAMTRARNAAAAAGGPNGGAVLVRAALRATALRYGIGVLSMAIFVLALVMPE